MVEFYRELIPLFIPNIAHGPFKLFSTWASAPKQLLSRRAGLDKRTDLVLFGLTQK